jgi:tetratricopeptide (TPR) repeat protein
VQLRTLTGNHRIRIHGPGIQEYEGIIEIENVESHRSENITVKSDPSAPTISAGAGNSSMVPASRLHIPSKAQTEFQHGSKALEQKDYSQAKKHFEAAIAIYPNFDLAYNGMGVVGIATGETQAARESFEKAITLNDHFAEAYRNLTRICLAERQYDEANDLLTKSLVSEPLNAWALTYAAYAELQRKQFDQAIAHARTAHSIPHEGLASVHIVAADAFEATMQPAEALDQYRIYLQEDPRGPDAARAEKAVTRLSGFLGK